MKALKFIVAGMVLFLAVAGQAQVDVTVNIGVPPPWGPAGYPDVRYYYLPDVESYHNAKYAKGTRGPDQKNIGEKPGNDNPGANDSQGGKNGNGKNKGQGGGNKMK